MTGTGLYKLMMDRSTVTFVVRKQKWTVNTNKKMEVS